MVMGRRPLLPKICAQSDTPSEKRRLRPIYAYNVSTVRASKKSSTTANASRPPAFQPVVDEVRMLPQSPYRVAQK